MHTPAGTSTKTVLHYAQEVQSGKFRQYDYGTRDNWKFYNQSSPPEYNLSLITAPVELYYAKNDWLATPKDVEEFYLKLKNRIGKYLVKLPQFNHLDFLWAKDVKTLVYDELIDRIKQFSPPLSEKKETLKVTSKWYSDIKGEYSHEKYPHEVRRNFQGLKR
ncbi:lipase 1 [Anabrus simplex]|uniref:lipase 1 n=1 Tax=Anabrus simplex TaxID=316456 RepID=UPI0035A313F5